MQTRGSYACESAHVACKLVHTCVNMCTHTRTQCIICMLLHVCLYVVYACVVCVAVLYMCALHEHCVACEYMCSCVHVQT